MSWSRGGIIAAGCALLLMAILAKSPLRAVLACALTLAALGCAAHFVRSSGERNGVSVAGANQARLRQWKGGLNAFITHPLIGVGVGDYAQQVVTERGSTSTVNVVEDPKNLIVSWLAERGVIGGILFVLFSCAIVTAVRQTAPSTFGAAIAAAWVGLLVAGMVDTPFGPASRPLGNCCFGLLIGCTGLLHRKCARDPVECNSVHVSATTIKQGDE
jgi:O-antigen ligase